MPRLLHLLVLLVGAAGCDVLGDLVIEDQPTAVRLVNDTSATLSVSLYYSDEQDIPELLLTSIGAHEEFTLQAGTTDGFEEDCDRLQAIIIEDAELELFGDFDASTTVLRDGEDFRCGDTLTFIFTQGLADLDLAFEVR